MKVFLSRISSCKGLVAVLIACAQLCAAFRTSRISTTTLSLQSRLARQCSHGHCYPQQRRQRQQQQQYNSHSVHHTALFSSITGEDSSLTFADFKQLPSWLVQGCRSMGFTHPTDVQARALPALLEGRDVVLQAQTGSGKTLTFALPLLCKIDASRAAIQAVVVVPTRELGLQVAAVMRQLAANSPQRIMVMSVVEGSNNRRQQLWATAEPPHVVVGNPLSLQRLVDSGRLRLHQTATVVLDEVDCCLSDTDAKQQLHRLLSRFLSTTFQTAEEDDSTRSSSSSSGEELMRESRVFRDLSKDQFAENLLLTATGSKYRQHRQTILCSATIPQRQHFAATCYKNGWTVTLPEMINVSEDELVPSQVRHQYVPCTPELRLACLKYVLRKEWKAWTAATAALKNSGSISDSSSSSSSSGGVSISISSSDGSSSSSSSSSGTATDAAVFQALVFLDPKKPAAAAELIAEELNQLCSELVSAEEAAVAEVTATAADLSVTASATSSRKKVNSAAAAAAAASSIASTTTTTTTTTAAAAAAAVGESSRGLLKQRLKARGASQWAEPSQLVCLLDDSIGIEARGRVMKAFRSGKCRILVCTDLAARGLDVPNTALVVQMSLPLSVDSYVHRAGRTGRCGRAGVVVTFAAAEEAFVVARFSNELGVNIDTRPLTRTNNSSDNSRSSNNSSSSEKKEKKKEEEEQEEE